MNWPYVTNLENKALFWLQTKVMHSFLDLLLQVVVVFAGHIECGEQIANETHEDGQIIRDNLGHVEIT